MLNRLKLKSEFSRNVLTLMTGTTIAQAIPIAISPILTRIYTPEDFGLFALYMSVVSILSVVATGRYEMAIMLPKKDEDAMNIVVLGFIINMILFFFVLLLVTVFNQNIERVLNNKEISFWLYFIPFSVFFIGLFNLLNYFNNRKKKYKDMSSVIIVKAVTLSVIQLVIGMMKSGVTGLITGQVISSMVSNFKLWKNLTDNINLKERLSKLKIIALSRKYKNFPKFQLPHAFLNSFSSNIPIYMFSIFLNFKTIGLYAMSIKIILNPLMILANAYSQVYNEQLSTIFRHNKSDAYRFTIKKLMVMIKIIIVPFLMIVIFAPDIFTFVFGESWMESGVYTQLLSPWLFMVFVVSTVSFVPSLMDKQKKALRIEIIYTLLRILSLFIGLYFFDIYTALFLFSLVGVIILSYNLVWILNLLKKVK